MEFTGSITQLKARINASGDDVKTVLLEVHGENFASLHALLRKPVEIFIMEHRAQGLPSPEINQ